MCDATSDAISTTVGQIIIFLSNTKTTAATDYSYDGNGNMVADKNKDITYIRYNHLNLPDSIVVTGKGNIRYIYDAAGSKLKKITTEGATTTTTTYLNGSVFKNDTLELMGFEEGRIRKTDSLVYDYMLKDHLGNVGMVLTTEKKTDAYPVASLETAQLTTEKGFYAKLDTGRVNKSTVAGYPSDTYTSPNDFIQQLNGSATRVGANMVLKVMAGDKFNVYAKSWYKLNGTTPGTPADPLTSLLASLNAGIGGITSTHGGATVTELQNGSILNSAANSFLGTHSTYTTSKPKAFVNWVLFDEQFKLVANSSGFEQVGADNTLTTHTRTNLDITKSGYLYIYVSNETPNVNVFFDNLQVTHIRGALLEETHYYPFGLVMKGISNKTLAFGGVENKAKFNNIELNSDFDLNMYDAFYRNLDPQIGRFRQIDPKPNEHVSSYAAMLNNPILFSDPLGDTTWVYGNTGKFLGVINDNLENQAHFLNREGGKTPFDASKLSLEDAVNLANSFRDESIAFMGSNTMADMQGIAKAADEKGYELGFVAEISESKEIRVKALSDKYANGDRSYDLIKAIDETYTKEQQGKLFAAGHVHNKKHTADVTGYDGYTGVMAKFLATNRPSTTNNGERTYPDFQPLLYRYDPSTKSYNKGQTPAFIISAYGVTTYGTGTGYGGLNNAVQNPVLPNQYNSYQRYKQIKK